MSNALFSALSSLLPRRNAGVKGAEQRGRRSAASTAPGSRALAEGLEGRVLLAVTVLSNGTGDGSLRVTVDAYGSYGSAAFPADDAFYDPIGPTVAQGSTFQSAVFLTGFNNFLTEAPFNNTFPPLPGAAFTSTTSNSAVSSFSAGGFGFVLTQSITPSVNGSTILNQQYVVTNNSGVAQNFQLIRHVDGDMFFVGGLGNDFAGVSADGRFVFEFDTATDPTQATAYFGITATGDGIPAGFTVQPFPYTDNLVAAGGIPGTDNGRISGDVNGDRLTDLGYDVTVTLADAFSLGQGASATYTTQTVFSQGSPAAVLNPGVLNLSPANVTVNETAGTATVTVTRTQGDVGVVSVNYALTDGSATAGADYTTASGILTFQDKQTTATFVVPILDDTIAEGDETINITLSAPTGGAVIGPARTGTITIADDEKAVQFNPATYDVSELSGTATLTLARTGPTTDVVTASYVTEQGTATESQDYDPVSGTVTFAAGQATVTVTVPIVNDFNDEESTESFTVRITGVTGPGLGVGTQNVATVNIANVDRPPSIYDITAIAPRGRLDALVLQLNDPLDPARATDLANYHLYLRNETRFGGPPSRTALPIKALEYTPGAHSLTVRPQRSLRQNQFYEIDVTTTTPTGVVSAQNQMLDGDLDRVAGEDFVGYFARGTQIVYSDRNGDRVKLGINKGGVLEVFRAVDREARVVKSIAAIPNKSLVFGKVTPRERQTDLATNIDLLQLGGAVNLLPAGVFRTGRTLK